MAFILKLTGDYLLPAIRCDCCGGEVTSTGFHLSRLTPDLVVAVEQATYQVCGEACYEDFVSARPLDEEWFALPIDAYLANLVRSLDIDADDVLERERAVSAAEHTRHEAPD
jgi:hypothetical protein